MRWSDPEYEPALLTLVESFRDAMWPTPPPGFEPITTPREMRAVLRGEIDSPRGMQTVVVKWMRPIRASDRASRAILGGKGAREGRLLRRLAEHGVLALRPLGWSDEGTDVLVTAWEPDLVPATIANEVGPETVRAGAALMVRAHAAGMWHRDLHSRNLACSPRGPLFIDLGGAGFGPPLSESARTRELARLRRTLLGRVRRTQCLRALHAYLGAMGCADVRGRARALCPRIEDHGRVVIRRYRRGRDRRTTRSGRHFTLFRTRRAVRAIRARTVTSDEWEAITDEWLAGRFTAGEPVGAGGRVVREAGAPGGSVVAVRRYPPGRRWRLPVPIRAFRVGEALRHRDVPVARPLLAAAGADGSGIFVTEWIEGIRLSALADDAPGHAALDKLARTIRLMHETEVGHVGISGSNIVVPDPEGAAAPVLTDVDDARIFRRPVVWSRRLHEAVTIARRATPSVADRTRFVEAYLRVPPWPRSARHAVLASVRASLAAP